jgi:hypothetical protein
MDRNTAKLKPAKTKVGELHTKSFRVRGFIVQTRSHQTVNTLNQQAGSNIQCVESLACRSRIQALTSQHVSRIEAGTETLRCEPRRLRWLR